MEYARSFLFINIAVVYWRRCIFPLIRFFTYIPPHPYILCNECLIWMISTWTAVSEHIFLLRKCIIGKWGVMGAEGFCCLALELMMNDFLRAKLYSAILKTVQSWAQLSKDTRDQQKCDFCLRKHLVWAPGRTNGVKDKGFTSYV